MNEILRLGFAGLGEAATRVLPRSLGCRISRSALPRMRDQTL